MSTAPEESEPWLWVVGIGDDGLASLSEAARSAVAAADVLVGGARHLAMLPDHPAERLVWRTPLSETLSDLAARRGRRVVVLASGDPMHFGVGELLVRHFMPAELRILPSPSVYSLICARLGWSLAEVETLSLHARPAALLQRYLHPGTRLIVLSEDGSTPGLIAATLVRRGFGPSLIWIFEHLGGARERCIEGLAEAWPGGAFAALNTVAIECRPGPDAVIRSPAPGLPDDAFESDGLLTKREVRATTLARLEPVPGQCLWDVGAGSGAVAIEWLRASRRMAAIAIERDAGRCARIRSNAERLGVPELMVVEGSAPACLAGLPPPDAVFIGGGLGTAGLLEACWQALGPGGRLVANAVTLEAERTLMGWQAEHGGELVRIAVSRCEPLGAYQGWRPQMPVTQLAVRK